LQSFYLKFKIKNFFQKHRYFWFKLEKAKAISKCYDLHVFK